MLLGQHRAHQAPRRQPVGENAHHVPFRGQALRALSPGSAVPAGCWTTASADVTDRAGALAMFDRRRDGLSQVQNVLVDGGYTGKPFATAVQGLLGASVEVVKRSELHTCVVLPKRWVVERSFAWLEKCRRLWKNCERKLNTSLQMVVLAFMVLILKRL